MCVETKNSSLQCLLREHIKREVESFFHRLLHNQRSRRSRPLVVSRENAGIAFFFLKKEMLVPYFFPQWKQRVAPVVVSFRRFSQRILFTLHFTSSQTLMFLKLQRFFTRLHVNRRSPLLMFLFPVRWNNSLIFRRSFFFFLKLEQSFFPNFPQYVLHHEMKYGGYWRTSWGVWDAAGRLYPSST